MACRCNCCGKFVSYNDIINDKAYYNVERIYVNTWNTYCDDIETIFCPLCRKKDIKND